MSDWIERDGKKYYEESYIVLANRLAKSETERLDWLLTQLGTYKLTNDQIWDVAAELCPVMGNEADNLPKWSRAAIDMMRTRLEKEREQHEKQ